MRPAFGRTRLPHRGQPPAPLVGASRGPAPRQPAPLPARSTHRAPRAPPPRPPPAPPLPSLGGLQDAAAAVRALPPLRGRRQAPASRAPAASRPRGKEHAQTGGPAPLRRGREGRSWALALLPVSGAGGRQQAAEARLGKGRITGRKGRFGENGMGSWSWLRPRPVVSPATLKGDHELKFEEPICLPGFYIL